MAVAATEYLDYLRQEIGLSLNTAAIYAAAVQRLLTAGVEATASLAEVEQVALAQQAPSTVPQARAAWGHWLRFHGIEVERPESAPTGPCAEFAAWLQAQGFSAVTAAQYAQRAKQILDAPSLPDLFGVGSAKASNLITAWRHYVAWARAAGVDLPVGVQAPPREVMVAARTIEAATSRTVLLEATWGDVQWEGIGLGHPSATRASIRIPHWEAGPTHTSFLTGEALDALRLLKLWTRAGCDDWPLFTLRPGEAEFVSSGLYRYLRAFGY